jgi:hypothetical protein
VLRIDEDVPECPAGRAMVGTMLAIPSGLPGAQCVVALVLLSVNPGGSGWRASA